jgi:hypothetical protein
MIIVDNKKYFQINLSVHGLNTRNKNQLHFPIANLLCCQRGVSYSFLKIFNSLPNNVENFRNNRVHFKIVLCKYLIYNLFYLHTEFFEQHRNSTYNWYFKFLSCIILFNFSYTIRLSFITNIYNLQHFHILLFILYIYSFWDCIFTVSVLCIVFWDLFHIQLSFNRVFGFTKWICMYMYCHLLLVCEPSQFMEARRQMCVCTKPTHSESCSCKNYACFLNGDINGYRGIGL